MRATATVINVIARVYARTPSILQAYFAALAAAPFCFLLSPSGYCATAILYERSSRRKIYALPNIADPIKGPR